MNKKINTEFNPLYAFAQQLRAILNVMAEIDKSSDLLKASDLTVTIRRDFYKKLCEYSLEYIKLKLPYEIVVDKTCKE